MNEVITIGPYSNRKRHTSPSLSPLDVHIDNRPCEKQQESPLQARKRDFTRKASMVILHFKSLELLEHKFLLFKVPSLWFSVTAALADYENELHMNSIIRRKRLSLVKRKPV